MISPNLLDTEMALRNGEALVEVAEIHKENRLRITEDGKTTDLIKTGLCDFDADRNQVRVFDGKAVVEDGRPLVKVKVRREVDLDGGDPMKVRKFDRKMAEDKDLYRWTSLRSSYLAEANTNYGRGVHYGPRTGLAGGTGRMMGTYGQGLPGSAGIHSMGGFRGGVRH